MATTSTRQCFTVAVLDNHVALDPDLTFALSLTATPTSVVASTLRSTVTILDSNGEYLDSSISLQRQYN